MKQKKISVLDWLYENKYYLIAFVLPIFAMLVVYYFKDVYPFGEQMYLRSDCYHQYTPYLEILKDKLAEGGSLLYTWEIGGGMNFVALAAYYLASPLNMLISVLPGYTSDIVSVFIIGKMGLASLAVAYYLTKHFGRKSAGTVAFGMAYAMSAYFAAFNWNIMWLDCMVLLPLIVLGLEKLVKEKKSMMYCLMLALAIFSNYYIGIMLCIFSVIYFIYLLCVTDIDANLSKARERFIIIKNYVFYSLMSGAMAACVILPEYYNLLMTRSADSTFPEALEEYFSVLYMFFRSLAFIPVADLKYAHDPNLYCSVAVFILVPLYIMCNKINVKERIGKTVLAIVFLLSFSFNVPNYIWHGLHFPNSLPCRESFIYIFLILVMAYEAFLHIREFTTRQLVGVTAGAVGLILVLEELFPDAEFFTNYTTEPSMTNIIYGSIAFILIYLVTICIYRKKLNYKPFFAYFMILVCFFELTINMTHTGLSSTSTREAYYESNNAFEQLNVQAKQDAESDNVKFYRSEEASHRTRNDGALFEYNSISTFSSVSSAAMQSYFDKMGMQTSYNAYSYYGHTPLTAALFSVKYEYTTGAASMPEQSLLVGSAAYTSASGEDKTLYLYENEYCLPLAFMIKGSTIGNWDLDSGNPFEVQNSFALSAVDGGSTIFHKLEAETIGTFKAAYADDGTDDYVPKHKPANYDVYFYCQTTADTLMAVVTNPDGTSTTQSFSSTNQNYICHLGNIAADSTVEISTADGSALTSSYAYAFDEEAFAIVYELLNAYPMEIETFEETRITGTITANEAGIMYTSIPYEEGWSVYVDGKEVKAAEICDDALLGIYLSEGTHDIEFKYCPKGFIPGITITVVAIILLLCVVFKSKILALVSKKKTKVKIEK